MPTAQVRGVEIVYQIIGDYGPWFALSTGGRRSHNEFVALAKKIAAGGFRVLLHDRRNTGASEVVISGQEGEEIIWADDLAQLLKQLGATPAFIGGASSGARLSILLKQRHPEMVKALVLMRVTGGDTAAKRLPYKYYQMFIDAAKAGGMVAVCATPDYQERIKARPQNESILMNMKVEQFIAVLENWLTIFTSGPTYPVMGVEEATLQAINIPVLIIPGNDRTHASNNAIEAAKLIPHAQLFQLPITDQDVDIIPFSDWEPMETTISERIIQFLKGLN
ncbi:MAG: alpha/beta hydrolase [Polynucleobacter sp.]|nr:alpha/beta hydrolase [Polynucleobacter sp.]